MLLVTLGRLVQAIYGSRMLGVSQSRLDKPLTKRGCLLFRERLVLHDRCGFAKSSGKVCLSIKQRQEGVFSESNAIVGRIECVLDDRNSRAMRVSKQNVDVIAHGDHNRRKLKR
jgi:hypothetical protein